MTIDRQCVYEFIDQVTAFADQYDVILSLGCGAGVQAMAEALPKIHIVPALNTTCIAETREAGCGSRIVGDAAIASSTILPISVLLPGVPRGFSTDPAAARKRAAAKSTRRRCAPGIRSSHALQETGRTDSMDEVYPPANWAKTQGKGPRKS